ncbi:hypothetical protein EDB81DRAFT_207483 [Dactylonectria macrodidyma]|uniref:Transcription factor domain-containing protein n=1 Tax=Dactylonectria macrodidyma TaxID=307937 RepID=A0A9P9DSJ9_9HYPO|nr:hypothetical protein EDB81DRAFT_207483 [Dactylonectria macrodidyma]
MPEPTHGISAAIELFTMPVDLVNLYVQTEPKSRKPMDLIAKASGIDQRLVSWNTSLPSLQSDQLGSGSAGESLDSDWLMWAWNYQCLCRVIANKVILDSLNVIRPLSQTIPTAQLHRLDLQYGKSSSTLSQIPNDIYTSIPLMMGSFENELPEFTLSSEAFFLMTIIQSLIKLTDQRAVQDNWSASACGWFGSRFNTTKDLVMRHLC